MTLRPAIRLYHHRGHKLKTAPASEPVTAAQFKAHIADTSLSDDDANDYVSTAREMIETATGLALISQVWELTFDSWPATDGGEWWSGVRQGAISELYGNPATIELPRYPLQDVDAVTVYDTASNSSAVTIASTFDIDTYSIPGRMGLQSGATWPVALRPTNAIVIEYTAGYGDNAADVPAPLRMAVKQVAAYLYSHRGDDCTADDALAAAGGVLDQYRVRRV